MLCSSRGYNHRWTGILFLVLVSYLIVSYFGNFRYSGRIQKGDKEKEDSYHFWKDFIDNLGNSSPEISNARKVTDKQACMPPKLELWHPAMVKYFKDLPPELKCAEKENWVFVENGTFRISPKAIKKNGEIKCLYTPIQRGKTDTYVIQGTPIVDIKDGTPLTSDFFKVECSAPLCVHCDKSYSNIHSGIAFQQNLHSRFSENQMPTEALGLNVLMFGLDSMSRMTYMRNLPLTHDYFVKELSAVVLEGYNILGSGTPAALLPMLTGKTELELPEAQRGKPNSKPVDGHPWVWKDFTKAGYVTQYGQDLSAFAAFNYRMHGFKNQPVDHYMRTFYLESEKHYSRHKRFCLGSTPRHLNMLNWIRDFYHMYKNKPKWSFMFHVEYSHDHTTQVRVADKDIKGFLQNLSKEGHLNNTLVILMSDHGSRFATLRQTIQGKYEEKMPYIGLSFPVWFRNKYPQAMENLRKNSQRLTTAYDIHETFKHILNFDGSQLGDVNSRGISLLNEVPLERTCTQAGIKPHWCTCLHWQRVPVNNNNMVAAALEILNKMNGLTEYQKSQCARLMLKKIIHANVYIPNNELLRFRKSKDFDGRIADFSDNTHTTELFIQITMVTTPGNGMFEVTLKVNAETGDYVFNEKEISRINKYGEAPHCIAARLPHLRELCYCLDLLPSN